MKYIFIDVDGVLNPFSDQKGFRSHNILVAGMVYKVNINPEHGKWMLQLAKDTDSKLVWGTTWQEYANEHIAGRVGLPDLPHLYLSDRKLSESLGSLKARRAVEYSGDARFVYFDDERDLGDYLTGSNGLHIHIDYWTGLSLEHVEKARNYLLS